MTKDGTRLSYTSRVTGEQVKQFRKAWERNDSGCLDTLMKEWVETHTTTMVAPSVDTTPVAAIATTTVDDTVVGE